MDFLMKPIGVVRGGRADPIDDDWGASRARIALDASRFDETALAGLEAFSHVEIIYVFDRVDEADVVAGPGHQAGHERHWSPRRAA